MAYMKDLGLSGNLWELNTVALSSNYRQLQIKYCTVIITQLNVRDIQRFTSFNAQTIVFLTHLCFSMSSGFYWCLQANTDGYNLETQLLTWVKQILALLPDHHTKLYFATVLSFLEFSTNYVIHEQKCGGKKISQRLTQNWTAPKEVE